MRAIMESLFSVAYLLTVIACGIYILTKSKPRKRILRSVDMRERQAQHRLFGIMTLILGGGDAFHLVPQVNALLGAGLEGHAFALGLGTLITSITMTIFYVLLYHVWRKRYGVHGSAELTICIYALAAARIALCLLPQNAWFTADAPSIWGIYRNIPFAILGGIIIVLYYRKAKAKGDQAFRFLWLAALLSFVFYIPVVLFADAYPAVGMLMIPKTLMYVWIVLMEVAEVKEADDELLRVNFAGKIST